MTKTIKIMRIEGDRLQAHGIEFFKQNPDVWHNLVNGKVVEVPDNILTKIFGVSVVTLPKIQKVEIVKNEPTKNNNVKDKEGDD